MTKHLLLGAGAALALALAAAPAMAQSFDLSAPAGDPPRAPADTGVRPVGTTLERIAIVRGDPFTNGQRRGITPPGSIRYNVVSDDVQIITESEWREAGWSAESFNRAEQAAQNVCRRQTAYIARANSLMDRYVALNGRAPAFAERYRALEGRIERAGNWRTAGSVIYGLSGWIFGPASGAATTGGAIGNEAQGEVWEDSMQLNREVGEWNLEYHELHGEYSLLSLENFVDYNTMVIGYCLYVYGDPAERERVAAETSADLAGGTPPER